MLRATLDLLTLKAFRPDIRNPHLPFGKREIDEPLLGLSLHRSGAAFCRLQQRPGSSAEMSLLQTADEMDDEQLREALVQYARKHYLRYAIGLLSHDFTIELRTLRTPPSHEESELLRRDPEAVLGEDIEKGDHHSLIRLPGDPGRGLVFTYKQAAIRRLEGLVHRSPLSFLQIGGGVEWALTHWLQHAAARSESRLLDLVLYDHPTITILQLEGGAVSPNIFCRTDSSGANPEDSPIIRKGLERYLRSGSRVVFIDLSLQGRRSTSGSAEAKSGGLPALLEDAVGAEDLTLERYSHPLELLLAETAS